MENAKHIKTKKIKIFTSIFIIVIILIFSLLYVGFKNTRIRLFMSVLHFSNETLCDPSYFLYDIDIMDLSHNYFNSDITITGRSSASKIKTLKNSVYMNIDAKRSFAQKRLESKSDMDVLFINVGQSNMYAENETVYLEIPMLGDFGYAFPTGIDLFMKMPDLTSDINQEWFHNNMKNIVTLMGQIDVNKTGEYIIDDDGTKSDEYVITIPKGCGLFIWELLGIDAPDYDVVTSLFLTPSNRTRRIFIDLSDVIEGASITLDGIDVATFIMNYELPENEKVELTMIRDPYHTNWINTTMLYYTNNSETFTTTASINWEKHDNYFDIVLKDIEMYREKNILCKAYFKGTISHTDNMTELFRDKEKYLYSLEKLEWRKIRDDTETFVNDMIDVINEKMK